MAQAMMEAPDQKIADLEKVAYELRIHQAELEMQNEELRRAQMRLAEAHDRYLDLYDFAPTGYFVLDNEWRIVEANNTAASLLGVERTKLVRKRLSAYLSETECDSFHFYLQKLQADPDLPPFEGWLRRGREEERLRGLLKVRQIDNGFRVALMDITPQRTAEEQLRKKTLQHADTSNRLHQIAKVIADVFYAVDLTTGRTLYLSDAFTVMFARDQEEGLCSSQRWLDFVHSDDTPRIHEAWQSLHRGEHGFDIEYRIVRPDGTPRLVRDRGYIDRTHNQVAGVLHDITQERAMETRLRQAQRMESLGTLAGGVAHDFNNLLMGIAGYLHLASERLERSHKAFAPIERALKSVMRGSTLTKQLVSFGDERHKPSSALRLDEVIVETSDLLRRLVGEQVPVKVLTDAAGIAVAADSGEIEQFLLNLASNARDAMPQGGELTLQTGVISRAGSPNGPLVTFATIAVTDTGCGMSDETRAKIFDPFFTTKELGKGTGLGLSTVLTVVRRLNGFVTVDSELGKGTTITVALPAISRNDSQAGFIAIDDAIRGKGETVLLVDDDPHVSGAVESYLETLNYKVLVANGPHQAALLCDQHRASIRMLICDVMMPETMGTVLAPRLQHQHGNLPVLFISAHSLAELTKQGHVTKETRLLSKPFDVRHLAVTLREMLDGRRV